jgi:cytochrome c-type biogenesis protein CcmH|tara:strand:- start:437 stop:889 length:453 start_codon:yes stop_codon:yes gene_type:complete
MSRRIAAAQRLAMAMLLILLSIEAFAIDPQQSFSNPADQQRYKMLTSEIRCLVCQNETIADSTALLANDLRREVRRMVEEGMSDAEIKDFLVSRYGDFVLYRPQFKSTTALLWLAPLLLLLIGGSTFAVVLIRRSRLPKDVDAPLMSDDQ